MRDTFWNKLKAVLTTREMVLTIALIAAGLIVSIFSPVFLSTTNLLSIVMSVTVEGLVAVGMVMLLASGELDLSVGMVMAFTGVTVGVLMTKLAMPVALAVPAAILVALVIGFINGFFVAKVGLNSFIMTLGMSCAIEGLMLVMANGRSITGLPDAFKLIGQGKLFGIQYPAFVLVIFVVAADFLFRNLRSLRQIYYIGSNAKAAKLNGINVGRIKLLCFCFTAFCAALAGILLTARFGSSSVTVGGSTPMDVITACIIGGASLSGGKGSVLGAVLGVLFLAMLSTALNLLSVNIYWQNFVTGAILIAAIFIDAMSERKKALGKILL
jgi:ribose transport system permease protein